MSQLYDIHVAVQLSQHHLLKRICFSHCIFLLPLLKIDCRCVGLFLSFLFCSIDPYVWFCVCVWHSPTILITVALWYCLISGRVMPPALFFFLRIALAILGLLWFHINSRVICSTSVKNVMSNLLSVYVLVTQSCPALCYPMDCSPPSSSVHEILQVRLLEWVAISSSRGSSWPRDQTCVSYVSCIGRRILYC